MSGRTPEELEAEITAQREQLAETVDQLTAKLDVKSQARARASALKDRATTEAGKPRPELVAAGSLVAMAVAFAWWWRSR